MVLEFVAPTDIPVLEWTNVVVEVAKGYAIYDGKNSKGEVIHTAVVTRAGDRKEGIASQKKKRYRLGLICPTYMEEYEVNERKMLALIYPPFKTLESYMKGYPSKSHNMVDVLKGIIQGLLASHNEAHLIRNIDKNTLVVKQEDGKGSLILLNTKKAGVALSDAHCKLDFVTVSNVIEQLMRKVPKRLKLLLDCFPLAFTKVHRERLLESPYFYSDWELVHGYIVKMFMAIESCPDLKLYLKGKTTGDVTPYVMNNSHVEVVDMWEEKSLFLGNYYEVFRFVRNCLEHVNQYWNKLSEIEKKNAQASFYGRSTTGALQQEKTCSTTAQVTTGSTPTLSPTSFAQKGTSSTTTQVTKPPPWKRPLVIYLSCASHLWARPLRNSRLVESTAGHRGPKGNKKRKEKETLCFIESQYDQHNNTRIVLVFGLICQN